MNIRAFKTGDEDGVAALITDFRVALAEMRGLAPEPDPEAAAKELANYRGKGFPIFVAETGAGELVGYLVSRVDGKVVWAESLYVSTRHRRRGVGSALYARAERLAEELGGETVYNWIHPVNDAIVSFLKGRGYSVLNLIEVRRPRRGEELKRKITVGPHEFDEGS